MKDYHKATRLLLNMLILVVALATSLVIGEGVLRLFLNPADYLVPALLDDPLLGVKIKPFAAGHDAWGFRNPAVPESVDIVTIGDSQTYGVSAPAKSSWPAQLQRLSGASVYNLALGGFGPAQYCYLLENRAVQLHPKWILVGFFLGNDLMDAYKGVYERGIFPELKTSGLPKEKFNEENLEKQVQSPFLAPLRQWLAGHSVLFRLIVHSCNELLGTLKMKYFYGSNGKILVVQDPEYHLRTGLIPEFELAYLGLDRVQVQEGLRFSLELLSRMDQFCQVRQIQFAVVLIPTKESVFAPWVNQRGLVQDAATLNHLVSNEDQVRTILKKYLQDHQIRYLDVLAPLREAVGKEKIYPSDHDGHPTARGYEIIARAVQQKLIASPP